MIQKEQDEKKNPAQNQLVSANWRVGIGVVVLFYPWFKFSFLLFQTNYHVIIIHYHTQKQKKGKFEPRIKLNHNIGTWVCSDVSIQILLKLAWIVTFMIQAYFRGTDMELLEQNFAVSPHQFATTGWFLAKGHFSSAFLIC